MGQREVGSVDMQVVVGKYIDVYWAVAITIYMGLTINSQFFTLNVISLGGASEFTFYLLGEA